MTTARPAPAAPENEENERMPDFEDYFCAWYMLAPNSRGFTHVLVDKKAGRRWLVHATTVRFPVREDGSCTVWSPFRSALIREGLSYYHEARL